MKIIIALLVFACAYAQEYKFSWVETPGEKYTATRGQDFCRRFGSDWNSVSINSVQENERLKSILASTPGVHYFWTSGKRNGNHFVWGDGSRVADFGWSHTGGFGTKQPDNRETPENCLSVLKNIYRDGIVWHDIHCDNHRKPVVCERDGKSSNQSPPQSSQSTRQRFNSQNSNSIRNDFNQNRQRFNSQSPNSIGNDFNQNRPRFNNLRNTRRQNRPSRPQSNFRNSGTQNKPSSRGNQRNSNAAFNHFTIRT